MKWMMKLRKYSNKMLKRENNPTSSSCLHFTGMNARFIGTENREMIRPTSLNVSFNEDVTSHVLSFKCSFCDAYIFTLQSFIIHLKSSHPNEDISQMLNDHFRSCITSIEKEKVIIVNYAFPRRDTDLYWNMNDDVSSNSDTPLCSPKSTNCYRDLEYEEQEAPNDGLTSTFTSGTMSIEDDSLISTEITSNVVNAGKWKNDWRSEYYLNTSNNENGGEEPNGITNLQDDAQLIENFSQRISGFSANQTSLGETKDHKSNIAPILLTENTRRRQMSTFEKMMALTCQKCGQKFKNRCMLTRHVMEHKRANNPYRCTIDGCLDSYAEKRKLLAHLNYKHTGLPRKEREIMVMKGNELLKKLHNMSSNGSSPYYSRILPIISPTVDITGPIMPLNLPSSSQAETVSISVRTSAATSNDRSLVPLSSATSDIISANHILKNMTENVECGRNDETSLKAIKSKMLNFDTVDNAPCITNPIGSKCSSIDTTHSLPNHNRSVKPENDRKVEVNAPTAIILKRNSGNQSLTVRELLSLDVANKRKIKCTNESLLAAKHFIKSEFSNKIEKARKKLI